MERFWLERRRPAPVLCSVIAALRMSHLPYIKCCWFLKFELRWIDLFFEGWCQCCLPWRNALWLKLNMSVPKVVISISFPWFGGKHTLSGLMIAAKGLLYINWIMVSISKWLMRCRMVYWGWALNIASCSIFGASWMLSNILSDWWSNSKPEFFKVPTCF